MNKKMIGIIAAILVAVVVVVIAVIGAFTVENPDKSGSSIVDEKVETIKTEEKSQEKAENDAVQSDKEQKSESKPQPTDSAKEEKVFTPTFMYFVSEKNAGYKEGMAAVEKLKKEYEGKVNFDIRDVDKNPENLENFPVADMIPALIMLNTNNDICAFSPMVIKYEDMKTAIDSAFAN